MSINEHIKRSMHCRHRQYISIFLWAVQTSTYLQNNDKTSEGSGGRTACHQRMWLHDCFKYWIKRNQQMKSEKSEYSSSCHLFKLYTVKIKYNIYIIAWHSVMAKVTLIICQNRVELSFVPNCLWLKHFPGVWRWNRCTNGSWNTTRYNESIKYPVTRTTVSDGFIYILQSSNLSYHN